MFARTYRLGWTVRRENKQGHWRPQARKILLQQLPGNSSRSCLGKAAPVFQNVYGGVGRALGIPQSDPTVNCMERKQVRNQGTWFSLYSLHAPVQLPP